MLGFFLLFFGILMIIYSALRCLKVFKYVRLSSYKNLWRLMFVLIIAFFFGYVAFTFIHFKEIKVNTDFLTIIIFAAGSIYVLMTVDLIYKTLEEDAILQRTTQEYAEKLEEMFQKKAVDLQFKNTDLEKMIAELTDSKKAMLNILEDMNISEEELEVALVQSESLTKVSQSVVWAKEFSKLVAVVTRIVVQSMEARRVILFIYNKETNRLEAQNGSSGLNNKQTDTLKIDINKSLNGIAFSEKKIMISDHAQSDQRIYRTPVLSADTVIISPITDGKNVMGTVCCLDSKKDINNEKTINFYEKLCKVISVVISNATLLNKIQVKENEEQAILKSIGSGLLVVDDKGFVLEMNKTAEENFGVKRENILHKSVQGILGFENLEKTLTNFVAPVNHKDFILKGERISCLFKDGKYLCMKDSKAKIKFPNDKLLRTAIQKVMNLTFEKTTGLTYSAIISPIISDKDNDNDNGIIIGQVLIMTDITKEITMNKAKDVFLSVTSHELRTPMTAISGNLRMVLDGEAGKIDNYTREFLEDAYSGSQRLLILVEDMLNVSRIEQGRMVYHMSNFNIVESAHRVIEYLKNIAKGKGLYIKYSPKKQSMLLLGDEGKVSEVLTNLMGNSLKFTEKGGITINQKVKGKYLVTYISDTGAGLKKEDRSKLFQKFFQVNLTLTNQKGGTGLGLYICRQYMKAMGGDIWIEKSVFGKGTTFAFSLPIAKKKTKEQEDSSTRKKIMI